MRKYPEIMPDDIARRLADLASDYGYGIECLTLVWTTKDLGNPLTARVTYESDMPDTRTLDGNIQLPTI
jgi:hypothetical protein